ncbi:MAG TPA: universal stress protein [Pyrinomonadaceae bacterium]|jgi:nucleotide-binding universal stress UspA family protein
MRVLITTDGSDFSRAAVEKCCELVVKPDDTAIKIVSVYELTLPLDVFPAPTDFSERLESSARAQAEEFAAQAAALIRERFPDSNIDLTTQIAIGSPEQILIEEAREWSADLVVVGSHGRGFWGRMLLGSTTDALVHHAPCSVLVVRKPR